MVRHGSRKHDGFECSAGWTIGFLGIGKKTVIKHDIILLSSYTHRLRGENAFTKTTFHVIAISGTLLYLSCWVIEDIF